MKTLFTVSKLIVSKELILKPSPVEENKNLFNGDSGSESDEIEQIFKIDGHRFGTMVILKEIGSTNDYLKSIAAEVPDGTIVLARSQLSGRGRRSRNWISNPDSSLIMSCLLKRVNWETLSWINHAMAVAICKTVNSIFSTNLSIKWPNDIVYSDFNSVRLVKTSSDIIPPVPYRKICGILSESSVKDATEVEYVVVGVGLNLLKLDFDFLTSQGQSALKEIDNNQKSNIDPVLLHEEMRTLTPVSIEELIIQNVSLGKRISTSGEYDVDTDTVNVPHLAYSIVNAFKNYLELIKSQGSEPFRKIYGDLCVTLNSDVRVFLDNDTVIEGLATAISSDGELIVMTESGVRVVSSGDVVHLRQPN